MKTVLGTEMVSNRVMSIYFGQNFVFFLELGSIGTDDHGTTE